MKNPLAPFVDHRRLLIFVLIPGWCAALFLARWYRAGVPGYGFLARNLVLAAIPAVAALLLVRADRERAPLFVRAAWFALWLLFLPNAPYIVTDFVHLRPGPPVPFWFDIAMVFSYAIGGVVLGYASVADVQGVVSRHAGRVAGWLVAAGSLLLAGFGIWMGRFLRWNSWDALLSPRALVHGVARSSLDSGDDPRSLGVTLVYGVGLVIGYVVLHAFVPHAPRSRDPR